MNMMADTGEASCAMLAAQLMPDHPLVWKYRIQVLLDLERPEEVLQACDQALASAPHNLVAHFYRGNALVMLRRYAEAIQSYGSVLAIDPEHADTHYNRAQTRVRMDEDIVGSDALALALQDAHQLLVLRPQEPRARWLYAAVLRALGEFDAAIPHYQELIRLDPSHPSARHELAVCWLSKGNWAQGWDEFERSNPIAPRIKSMLPPSGQPWRGEPLTGKSILLVSSCGLGDTLNFMRYVPSVRQMAASVSIWVQPELQNLLERSTPESGQGRGTDHKPHDYYCNFMTLPQAFGTRPDTVPMAHGYLQADAAKTSRWQHRLGNRRRLRVGLAWSGNPRHLNDHNRSMSLSALAGVLQEPDIDYCCLQQVVRDSDQDALRALPQLAFLGDELQDLDDTAALCAAMDLVISVDTSIAHLAGALGKPVWILLPFVAEFRWMMGREDTPWYSRARLFRQTRRGDWTDVVARVRSELKLLEDGPWT